MKCLNFKNFLWITLLLSLARCRELTRQMRKTTRFKRTARNPCPKNKAWYFISELTLCCPCLRCPTVNAYKHVKQHCMDFYASQSVSPALPLCGVQSANCSSPDDFRQPTTKLRSPVLAKPTPTLVNKTSISHSVPPIRLPPRKKWNETTLPVKKEEPPNSFVSDLHLPMWIIAVLLAVILVGISLYVCRKRQGMKKLKKVLKRCIKNETESQGQGEMVGMISGDDSNQVIELPPDNKDNLLHSTTLPQGLVNIVGSKVGGNLNITVAPFSPPFTATQDSNPQKVQKEQDSTLPAPTDISQSESGLVNSAHTAEPLEQNTQKSEEEIPLRRPFISRNDVEARRIEQARANHSTVSSGLISPGREPFHPRSRDRNLSSINFRRPQEHDSMCCEHFSQATTKAFDLSRDSDLIKRPIANSSDGFVASKPYSISSTQNTTPQTQETGSNNRVLKSLRTGTLLQTDRFHPS